jgi:hypothetical protein
VELTIDPLRNSQPFNFFQIRWRRTVSEAIKHVDGLLLQKPA